GLVVDSLRAVPDRLGNATDLPDPIGQAPGPHRDLAVLSVRLRRARRPDADSGIRRI
ncbi:MAG: hypothetical protein AVDCRST_MAG87-3122, partial [uncultured Thermomicrobiales bacterium]